jgi:hypothetical protein
LIPPPLDRRLEGLINDLIEEGGVTSASLASILVAAQDAVHSGYHVALCRRVWSAACELEAEAGVVHRQPLVPEVDPAGFRLPPAERPSSTRTG